MFFLKEYQKYFVSIHLREKTLFYGLKGSIPIDDIRIKYKVFYEVFDKKLFAGTQLFFYSYFNKLLIYNNISTNNHICYRLKISNLDIFYYNFFYNNFLTFLHNTFNTQFYIQEKLKNSFDVQFRTLQSFGATDYLHDITSVNSLLHIYIKSNVSCYFFYKVFISHVFLNV